MDALAEVGIIRIRAENPGLLTGAGTNTWIVGHDPCFIVDPGPALPAHVAAVADAAHARGGAGGVALTHDHSDHVDALPALLERLGDVPVGSGRHGGRRLGDGDRLGPLRVVATPGHAEDHLAFLADTPSGPACFTGDAVLGEGSVFVAPRPGALRAYLAGLERLRALRPAVICPGHGPPVWDADAKLAEYLAHRRDRERRLVAALAAGARAPDELLDAAWDDVPAPLRPVAALTLAAHLSKLAEEGRLPPGVELPPLPDWGQGAP